MTRFLNNKYLIYYFHIIEYARKREILNEYYEKHHIVPKSLGGLNNKENLVCLTPREHFICHLLLTKITEGTDNSKMWFAFKAMSRANDKQDRYINSRLYQLIKGNLTHTEETKKKLSKSHTGLKQTPETIEKRVSQIRGKSSPLKGRKIHTVESKFKISHAVSKRIDNLSEEEKKKRLLDTIHNPKNYTKERSQKISNSRTGYKDTDEACKNKSIAALKRDNSHLLVNAAKNKGRIWKKIGDKRVWLDKEIEL